MSESLANRLSPTSPPAAGGAFWALLAEPERAALRAAGRTRTFAAGAPMCHEGAPARQVFILLEGWVKETSATEDGHEIILELRGPGEVVGAPAAFARYHRATATAVEEVRVLVLEVRRFLALLDGRPPAARALMQVMSVLLHAADRRHALSQSGGAQRLALRLLELADRYGSAEEDGSVQILLPLAQHEIAGWAGISRETAARALRSWRRTGIVETARKQIRITDLEALRNTVGGWQEPAIARPPSLEAVGAARAAAPAARLAPATSPAQLPQDIPDFTGRAQDLGTLDEMLRSGKRTLVIQGMAGVGKTALAVRWAHAIAAEFPDGQLFLDLRGHAQRPAVTTVEALGQLLRALDVPAEQVPPAADEQAALYRSRLADRRVLIVLDDATGSEQVRPLLPGNPHSLVVVTSRGQLSGLVARDGARSLDLGVLSEQEAIDLVSTVLGAGDPRVADQAEQAAELTRRCAYLPLAVRIAAANLAVHPQEPIEAVVNELGEHDRLSALALDEEPHGAVRTAFELSYRDLDDDTRQALRLLALMPGLDFTLEAMAALLGTELDRARVLLRGLERAHLVDVPTQSRYRLHDLVRDFAFERLAAEDDVADCEAAERRLLGHYLRQAQESSLFINEHRRTMRGAKPQQEGARDLAVREPHMAWFESERLNLVAVAHRAKDLGPPRLVWELADAVYDFLELRRYSTTNMSIHLLALDAARQADQPTPTAVMHHHLAVALLGIGRYTEALEHDAEARRIFRSLGDRNGEAATLESTADVAVAMGRYTDALAHSAACLELHRTAGNRRGEAEALDSLARSYRRLGDNRAALEHATEALQIRRAIEDLRGEAETLENISRIHARQGRFRDSARYGLEALSIRQEVTDRHGEAETLGNLARTYRRLGLRDESTRCARLALEIHKDIGDLAGQAEAIATLGLILQDAARYPEALGNYAQSLEIRRRIGDRRGEGMTLGDLALVSWRLGHYPNAREHAEEALEIRREIGDRSGEAEALEYLSRVLRRLGDYQEAVVHGLEALEIRHEIGDRQGVAESLESLARTYRRLGVYDAALDAARQALRVRRQIGNLHGEGATLDTVARILRMMGRAEESIAYAREALALQRYVGDRYSEGTTLDNLAKAHLDLGKPEEALRLALRALRVEDELFDQYGRATTLQTVGDVCLRLGLREEAVGHFTEAAAVRQEIQDPRGERESLSSLAKLQDDLGRPAEAEQTRQRLATLP